MVFFKNTTSIQSKDYLIRNLEKNDQPKKLPLSVARQRFSFNSSWRKEWV